MKALRIADASGVPEWDSALVDYMDMSEQAIEQLLAMPASERSSHEWLVLAAIALDQGDVDPRRVLVR